MITHARATLLRIGPLLFGCSTLAPLPVPQECDNDDDCPSGELCAPDTRVCVPASNLPPLADLGFDIQELVGGQVVFRAEVTGCDQETVRTQSMLSLTGRELEQTFEIVAYVRDPAVPGMPVVEDLLVGAMELTQPSRFARAPLAPPRIDYPSIDNTGEVATLLPTALSWPRYHPFDVLPPVLKDGGFVLWRSIPTDGAPVLQMLVAPNKPCTLDTQCCALDESGEACDVNDPNFCLPDLGHCTAIGNPHFGFSYKYEDRCNRTLAGEVVVIDGQTLETRAVVADVPLTLRHADTESMPRLGVHAIDSVKLEDRPSQCTSDAGCIADEQFCDPDTNQCVLALAGRPADNGSTLTAADGTFEAQVYTYCEAELDNVGIVRSFTVSAAPSGPLAALSYTFDASIGPLGGGDQKPVARVPKRLCIPDWGASVPLSLRLVGEAVPLLGSGADGFVCCDVGCLPASEEVAGAEPTQLTTCDGRTASGAAPIATVSATLSLDAADLLAWDKADCQPPDRGADGIVGGIRRKMDCTGVLSDATCVAPDLAAGSDGTPRDYVLRLESPVGSVFASKVASIAVEASGAVAELELERRVLVRGRVLLDATGCAEAATLDGDCGSEGAVVRAERLRMPEDDDDMPPGPYFHELPTFFDPIDGRQGGYVLPLDRGVYLLTAVPLSGSRGGPAEISVLDLRDGQDVERDLVLNTGVLVTLDLNGFDPRAQILPLDRGSWRALVHPGRADDPDPVRRTVDLNAIGECLQPTDDRPQGCRIRQIISGASLSASQVGQVRFTARANVATGSCPG